MAYKSQVTNKYMGSSFAGRVNPGRENELTQLVETLSATDRALSNAVPKYKQKQVEKAEAYNETVQEFVERLRSYGATDSQINENINEKKVATNNENFSIKFFLTE